MELYSRDALFRIVTEFTEDAVINHEKRGNLTMPQWREMFNEWMGLYFERLKIEQPSQDSAWNEHLDELGSICMQAPISEPDRRNHLLQKLSSKYLLIKK